MDSYPSTVIWTGSTAGRDFNRDAVASAPGKPEIAVSAGTANAACWNPEDMLCASLSTCHMLTFLALASKVGIDVRQYEGHAEAILETEDKITRVTRIRLTPRITVAAGSDEFKVGMMFEKAHRYCFIGNSLTSEVEMVPEIVVLAA